MYNETIEKRWKQAKQANRRPAAGYLKTVHSKLNTKRKKRGKKDVIYENGRKHCSG